MVKERREKRGDETRSTMETTLTSFPQIHRLRPKASLATRVIDTPSPKPYIHNQNLTNITSTICLKYPFIRIPKARRQESMRNRDSLLSKDLSSRILILLDTSLRRDYPQLPTYQVFPLFLYHHLHTRFSSSLHVVLALSRLEKRGRCLPIKQNDVLWQFTHNAH